MTELEREEVLGERADRVAQLQQRRQLREMVKRKERREHGQRSDEDDDDKDSDSGTLRRKPKAKAPASKYDKLKRSRAERGKKKERVVSRAGPVHVVECEFGADGSSRHRGVLDFFACLLSSETTTTTRRTTMKVTMPRERGNSDRNLSTTTIPTLAQTSIHDNVPGPTNANPKPARAAAKKQRVRLPVWASCARLSYLGPSWPSFALLPGLRNGPKVSAGGRVVQQGDSGPTTDDAIYLGRRLGSVSAGARQSRSKFVSFVSD